MESLCLFNHYNYAVGGLIWPIQNDAKNLLSLAYGYSSESTQLELSNEY